jgi:hypothetical protein
MLGTYPFPGLILIVLLLIFLNLLTYTSFTKKNADIESYSADEVMIRFLIMHIYDFILKQNQASLIHQIP